MFDIITFGSALVDIFAETDIAEKGRFMCYPVGSKILLKNLRFDIGGGGTNTAVAFSRFGFKTGYIGKIGDDFNGKIILKILKDEKIKFLGKIEKKSITGTSIILDSKEHDRTVLKYSGVNDDLNFSDINLKKIKTKWFYLGSMLGESFKTQKKLAFFLHVNGVKIAINPTEYLIKKENIMPLLKISDILILNKEEASLLVKKRDLLKGLHKLGPKTVVITDKNKKILAYDGKKKYSLMPNKIKVVERTGAGDAFASGFVAGQMVGKNIQESLKLGLREGESVLKYVGAKNKLLEIDLKNENRK